MAPEKTMKLVTKLVTCGALALAAAIAAAPARAGRGPHCTLGQRRLSQRHLVRISRSRQDPPGGSAGPQ